MEQEAPEPDLGPLSPPDAGVESPPMPSGQEETPPPSPSMGDSEVIDTETDDEVEKIDDNGDSEESGDEDSSTEELDITDLVDSQKNIENRQEEYFENLFSQLSNLETKLSEMDNIMNKLNDLENKIEKYREKTPEEKLELRSYDSYPFNQKLSDFFDDKKQEMEISGKNDYILTSNDVVNINPEDIKTSFSPNKGISQ